MSNHLFFSVISVASVLLTINGATTGSKVESFNPDHNNCNLIKDQTDEYFELVFEYSCEDLDGMSERVLSIPGVKSRETTWIYYTSNHIRFQMNRTAYYIVSAQNSSIRFN